MNQPVFTISALKPAENSRLIVAAKSPSATIQFYGLVGEVFGGFGAARFAAALDEVKGSKSVTMYMSSEGGDFLEAIAIYSQLVRFAESHDLAIVVDGIAASAGSLIVMSAPQIRMSEPAQIMIHEARGGRYGTAAEMRAQADVIDGANETMVGIYSKRSGLTPAQIRAFFANGDTYFTAPEAVDLGFADAIEGKNMPEEMDPKKKRKETALLDRQISAARINAQLARERREAASRPVTQPGQPGPSTQQPTQG